MVFIASECSGPARFDWHGLEHVWVYRRTKAQLLPLLEEELSQLMGKSITLKDWCSLFFWFWLSSLFWARERDGSKQRDACSGYYTSLERLPFFSSHPWGFMILHNAKLKNKARLFQEHTGKSQVTFLHHLLCAVTVIKSRHPLSKS
jgi:hypothetical protein